MKILSSLLVCSLKLNTFSFSITSAQTRSFFSSSICSFTSLICLTAMNRASCLRASSLTSGISFQKTEHVYFGCFPFVRIGRSDRLVHKWSVLNLKDRFFEFLKMTHSEHRVCRFQAIQKESYKLQFKLVLQSTANHTQIFKDTNGKNLQNWPFFQVAIPFPFWHILKDKAHERVTIIFIYQFVCTVEKFLLLTQLVHYHHFNSSCFLFVC